MGFDGQRLRVLRNLHALTQRELAERVAVSGAAISLYEKNVRGPDDEVIDALCDELGVERDYFSDQLTTEFSEVECNFRRSAAASERLRRQVLAHGTLLAEWVDYLQSHIRFPDFDVPQINVGGWDELERAAEACRAHWDLGLGPIQQVTRVLENAGVIVTQLSAEHAAIDAFSRFEHDLNVVVLNTVKGSSSRSVFDCAHELAHGVLHRGPVRKDRQEMEREADYFAGAFLLPRSTFPREFWFNRTLSTLATLKERWGVSIQAMVYRGHQLSLITTAEFRRLQKQISKRGWRRGVPEPAEPESVQPELLNVAVEQFQQITGKTSRDMAADLHWTPNVFGRVTGIDIAPQQNATISLESFRTERSGSDRN